MIVIADAGPLHYLMLIGAVDVLAALYIHVLVPNTVFEELKANARPLRSRLRWMPTAS